MTTIPPALQWFLIVFLVLMSGLFSGLNLGLMGLDVNQLESVMSGDEPNAGYARKIKPLRNFGNWLLCTLLLGNVAVNAGLSILLADLSSGVVGFILSTALIVIFGEIIPQAACSRHALIIGAYTRYLVYALMATMAVVAWPVSKVLDWVLGDEIGNIYTNKELEKLVQIHAEVEQSGVSKRAATVLSGALGLDSKFVSDVMTPMDNVFLLPNDTKLSFDVLSDIFKSGHSRIPIISITEQRILIEGNWVTRSEKTIVGILYVKDLILIDPDDEMPVVRIMQAFGHRKPPEVYNDMTLNQTLRVFTQAKQHIAVVKKVVSPRSFIEKGSSEGNVMKTGHSDSDMEGEQNARDKVYELSGIITLEDVIEEILQAQLIDEHDNYEDRVHTKKTGRLARIDWSNLQIFDHRKSRLTSLPPQELQAVFHFLTQQVRVFQPQYSHVNEASIKNLLQYSKVVRVVVGDSKEAEYYGSSSGYGSSRDLRSDLGGGPAGGGFGFGYGTGGGLSSGGEKSLMSSFQQAKVRSQRDPYKMVENNGMLLYQTDTKTEYFTLILDGTCEVFAGRQGFRSEVHCWSYLCPEALEHVQNCVMQKKPVMDYVADFTCKVKETARVLRISLKDFEMCLKGKFEPAALEQALEHAPLMVSKRGGPAPLFHDASVDRSGISEGSLVPLKKGDGFPDRAMSEMTVTSSAITSGMKAAILGREMGLTGGFGGGSGYHSTGELLPAPATGGQLHTSPATVAFRLVPTTDGYTYPETSIQERNLYQPSMSVSGVPSEQAIIGAAPSDDALLRQTSGASPALVTKISMPTAASAAADLRAGTSLLTPKAADSVHVPPGYVLVPVTEGTLRSAYAATPIMYHAKTETAPLIAAVDEKTMLLDSSEKTGPPTDDFAVTDAASSDSTVGVDHVTADLPSKSMESTEEHMDVHVQDS